MYFSIPEGELLNRVVKEGFTEKWPWNKVVHRDGGSEGSRVKELRAERGKHSSLRCLLCLRNSKELALEQSNQWGMLRGELSVKEEVEGKVCRTLQTYGLKLFLSVSLGMLEDFLAKSNDLMYILKRIPSDFC